MHLVPGKSVSIETSAGVSVLFSFGFFKNKE